MPIRPELRALYASDWIEISRSIRADRAQWRCENCASEHRAWGWRDDAGIFHPVDAGALRDAGYVRPPFLLLPPSLGPNVLYLHPPPSRRVIEIQIGVAHLDHDPRNNAPDNLRALCRGCHLAYDRDHHRRTAAATRRAWMNTPDLFDPDMLEPKDQPCPTR